MKRITSVSLLALALAGCVNMAPDHTRPALASAAAYDPAFAPDGTVTADPLTPGTYILTYSIGTGTCLSTDTRELEIRPLPAIALSVDDPTVCDGTPAEWTTRSSWV